MSAPPASGDPLDWDTTDTVRLTLAEASGLGSRALLRLSFPDDDVCIIIKRKRGPKPMARRRHDRPKRTLRGHEDGLR